MHVFAIVLACRVHRNAARSDNERSNLLGSTRKGPGSVGQSLLRGKLVRIAAPAKGTDMTKPINFAARKAAVDTERAFFELVRKDIEKRPESVVPLSVSLRDRAKTIEALARANQDAERLEC